MRLGFLCWTFLTFWNTSGGYLIQTFNSQTLRDGFWQFLIILIQNNLAPKRYSQKFSKLNWEKMAPRHLLKSQKYWNCKVLLAIIATTIRHSNSLFVLYYCSSQCRRLLKLLMKWDQFINNYQKSTLGGPMMKQFVLHILYVLPRHTNIIIFSMNTLPDVYICSHRKKSAPLLPEGTVKCTHLAA